MNPHHVPPASPNSMVRSLFRNRELIFQLTKREVVGRYRSSFMGLAWSLFNPVLMLAVYTFVFSVVFKARWNTGGSEDQTSFAIILFVGLILYGLFSECINRAPTLVLSNINYVKKVVFPLEILPWVAMGSALFHTAISLLVLLTAQLVINHALPWTVILFPLVLVPLMLGIMGVAWGLASLGVYVRDIAQTTSLLTTVLMFVSPVFYPIANLPEKYQDWVRLNPLTFILEEGRKTLVYGRTLDWGAWGVFTFIGFLVAWGGYWWFQKTRKGFADVI